MNKPIKYLLIATMVTCMVSCSTGYYLNNSQNVNLNQTQVVLSQANFQVVKHVKVTYVYKNLSSRYLSASQIKESAYAALVKEAKLTGAQVIINVTLEHIERCSFGLFGIPHDIEQAIVASGIVIEFLPNGIIPTNSNVTESHPYTSTEGTSNSQSTTIDTVTVKAIQLSPEYTNSHKSSYSLLKARYKNNYPSFWNAIIEVRQYLGYNEDLMNKVTLFLLSDNEQKINALIQEVANKKDLDAMQLSILFVNYAE